MGKSKYYTKNMSTKKMRELMRALKEIGKAELGRNFKMRIVKGKHSFCYPKDYCMWINIEQKKSAIVHSFFHELAHLLNWRDGKFKEYHNSSQGEDLTIKHANAIVKTGIKAEKYTDARAFILLKKYGIEIDWDSVVTYFDPKVQNFFRKNFIEEAKAFIRSSNEQKSA